MQIGIFNWKVFKSHNFSIKSHIFCIRLINNTFHQFRNKKVLYLVHNKFGSNCQNNVNFYSQNIFIWYEIRLFKCFLRSQINVKDNELPHIYFSFHLLKLLSPVNHINNIASGFLKNIYVYISRSLWSIFIEHFKEICQTDFYFTLMANQLTCRWL